MLPNYPAIAEAYCWQVQDGTIAACHWVRRATLRHLDDLARQATADFPFVFDEPAAARACGFVERLPHVKGRLATQPLRLEPYQIWIVASLFGWVHAIGHKAGKRRFRRAMIELPRSSGKSALSSAISLYMLAADREGGADCYSAATTRDQARVVFDTAQAMARSPLAKGLMDHLGVRVNAHTIVVQSTNSKFLPLSAEANSLEGLSIHYCSVDETHAHRTRDVWDAIVLGAAKREQSLVLGITTAGFDLAGIGYELHTYLCQVLDGIVQDETQFGCIWSIDPEDDWQDPASWRKANPGLGTSVDEDYFMAIAREAIAVPSKQPGFKTKFLDLWLSNYNAWADLEAWKRCMGPLDIADFKGLPCYMGLDLGAKTDLAAKCLIFPKNGQFYVFPTHYLPDSAIHDGRNASYKGWAIDGHIKTHGGAILDYDEIEADIVHDLATYDVRDIGVDPWEATQLVQKLMAAGATVTEVMQTVAHLSEPAKELDAMSRAGTLHFDCPVLLWCASNVVVREDTNGNIKPNKNSPVQKIDSVIALILAIARMLVHEDATSVYEQRGLTVF